MAHHVELPKVIPIKPLAPAALTAAEVQAIVQPLVDEIATLNEKVEGLQRRLDERFQQSLRK